MKTDFNDVIVKIKLTKVGLSILKIKHDELRHFRLNAYADGPVSIHLLEDFKVPEVDENGYATFTLCELMQTFGKYMYEGNCCIPFENIIIIDEVSAKERTR